MDRYDMFNMHDTKGDFMLHGALIKSVVGTTGC